MIFSKNQTLADLAGYGFLENFSWISGFENEVGYLFGINVLRFDHFGFEIFQIFSGVLNIPNKFWGHLLVP